MPRTSVIALTLFIVTPVVFAQDSGQAAAGDISGQYRDAAARIREATLAGNDAYTKLQELCDDIGHRLSGSPGLERAVQWAADAMKEDGQENVRLEKVMVPHWVRGKESLAMVSPREHDFPMLGLGGSVGTPPEGLTAEVLVVADEKELAEAGERARGKIVLFNRAMPPYDPETGPGYGTAVYFRTNGARLAAEQGAVACLIRSVTATSLRTPHTGAMRYGDAQKKIPAAAITVEDTEMLARMQARGVSPTLTLKMEAKTLPDAESANVVGELRGRELPEEIVVIGGHIDAWDVGQGAHDDGGGCVIAMEAINVLRKLDLVPRRTIRVVLWTNEENGIAGARQYVKDHEAELPQHVAAIESDGGIDRPLGFSIDCEDDAHEARAAERLKEILKVLEPLGATDVQRGFSGVDVGPMRQHGVPTLGHLVDVSKYFNYHHSPADTIEKIDPAHLSQNVAVMATLAYVLADMPGRLGD